MSQKVHREEGRTWDACHSLPSMDSAKELHHQDEQNKLLHHSQVQLSLSSCGSLNLEALLTKV